MIGINGSLGEPLSGARERHSGWVFWITGLSGAGKTTVGRRFHSILSLHYPLSVFLDGDDLRKALMPEAGYTLADRWECARRYGALCKELSEQGLHVVIATISMFEECRRWNRRNFLHYFEVYLHAPDAVLEARDHKGLYRGGDGARSVVARDLPWDCPADPDIIIENDGRREPDRIARSLWREVSVRMRAR